jgi:ArsR family transcriptional regulator, lead/cadmium/zinc/bismuth-responsive transcriptional repressor
MNNCSCAQFKKIPKIQPNKGDPMQYKNLFLEEDDLFRLEEIYKLFGSMPRLKILVRLSKGECGVTELCEVAGLTQSATSHQLKDLKQCRVVKSRKEGLNVYYSLDDDHIVKILDSGIEHIKGDHCE